MKKNKQNLCMDIVVTEIENNELEDFFLSIETNSNLLFTSWIQKDKIKDFLPIIIDCLQGEIYKKILIGLKENEQKTK